MSTESHNGYRRVTTGLIGDAEEVPKNVVVVGLNAEIVIRFKGDMGQGSNRIQRIIRKIGGVVGRPNVCEHVGRAQYYKVGIKGLKSPSVVCQRLICQHGEVRCEQQLGSR